MRLGQLIADHREKRGLSLQQLAKEIGITYTALRRLEQGMTESKQWPTVIRWLFKP